MDGIILDKWERLYLPEELIQQENHEAGEFSENINATVLCQIRAAATLPFIIQADAQLLQNLNKQTNKQICLNFTALSLQDYYEVTMAHSFSGILLAGDNFVKCLLGKHKDLSSGSRTPFKDPVS